MALSILNNISALTAQNQLSTTQANLQRTLTQLSSGLKINTGADDAAGLSIANGLTANIAALTQSQQNASSGIGLLQTADGALAQVTALLNRAVTLATEASNSTLNGTGGSQATALNTEFTSILNTINSIGSKTQFNGSQVFTASSLNIAMSDGTTGGDMSVLPTIGTLTTAGIGLNLAGGSATMTGTAKATNNDTVAFGGGTTYTFKDTLTGAANEVLVGANLAESLGNLAAAINGGAGAGAKYGTGTAVNSQVSATLNNDGTALLIQNKDGVSHTITIAGGTTLAVANGAAGTSAGAALNLNSVANAKNTLTQLTTAISNVAAQRGTVGAAINQLQSASNIMNAEVQNLSSAQNSVLNADIGKTVADMTQFNILQSTGMSALQQANQAQQSVLKLLQ